MIVEQYDIFKDRLKEVASVEGETAEVVKQFEHLVFCVHSCSKECSKSCLNKGKVLQPRVSNLFKLLNIFMKEPVLYSSIQAFLHLYLRFVMKVV